MIKDLLSKFCKTITTGQNNLKSEMKWKQNLLNLKYNIALKNNNTSGIIQKGIKIILDDFHEKLHWNVNISVSAFLHLLGQYFITKGQKSFFKIKNRRLTFFLNYKLNKKEMYVTSAIIVEICF